MKPRDALIGSVLELESELKDNSKESYEKLLGELKNIPKQLTLSLKVLSEDPGFKELKMPGMPTTDKERSQLVKKIWDPLSQILKAVQIASLAKDSKGELKINNGEDSIRYETLIKVCQDSFVAISSELVKNQVIPPIIPDDKTQLLFWSSNLGKQASNAYAVTNHAVTDTIASKYIGRILSGWRSEDLPTDYKSTHGAYLNVLYPIINFGRNPCPYEDLRKFYWDAYSEVYASQISISKASPLVYILDSLTEGNFFMNTELPTLREQDKHILVEEMTKKLKKLKIKIPGHDELTNEIKESDFSISIDSKIEKGKSATFIMTLDLLDSKKNNEKTGKYIKLIEKSTTDSITKQREKTYSLEVELEGGGNRLK